MENVPRDPYNVYNQNPQFYDKQPDYVQNRNSYPEHNVPNRMNSGQQIKPMNNQMPGNYGNVPSYEMGINNQKNYKNEYEAYPQNRNYQEHLQNYDMPPNYQKYPNSKMDYPQRNIPGKQDFNYDYSNQDYDSNYNLRKTSYQQPQIPTGQGYPAQGIKSNYQMYQGYAPEPPRMKPNPQRGPIEQNDPYDPYNRRLNQYERHTSSTGQYEGSYHSNQQPKYAKVSNYNREPNQETTQYSQRFEERGQPRFQYEKPDYNKNQANKGNKASKKGKPRNREDDSSNYYNNNNSQNEGKF